MKPPFFRTPYNYDTNAASDDSGLKCLDPTLAQQHFKDECDINVLFARYLDTGEMPQVQDGLSYGDFTGIYDFQTAMNAVRAAENVFTQLPARIKNRFDNDPQKLLSFMGDPDNREEAEFLGLINKPAPQGDLNDTGTERVPTSATQAETRSSGTARSTTPPKGTEKSGPETTKSDH